MKALALINEKFEREIQVIEKGLNFGYDTHEILDFISRLIIIQTDYFSQSEYTDWLLKNCDERSRKEIKFRINQLHEVETAIHWLYDYSSHYPFLNDLSKILQELAIFKKHRNSQILFEEYFNSSVSINALHPSKKIEKGIYVDFSNTKRLRFHPNELKKKYQTHFEDDFYLIGSFIRRELAYDKFIKVTSVFKGEKSNQLVIYDFRILEKEGEIFISFDYKGNNEDQMFYGGSFSLKEFTNGLSCEKCEGAGFNHDFPFDFVTNLANISIAAINSINDFE